LLSSTFQDHGVVNASLQVNCRPNLMPTPCMDVSDAGSLRTKPPPAKFSDASEAASDASTGIGRSSMVGSSSDEAELEPLDGRTTVMMRNLPEGFSRTLTEQLLDAEGFGTCYRFIYLPTDIATGSSFFYAFIDLATPEDASLFRQHFTGFTRWRYPSSKVAAVDWSEALQGIDQLVERYRNSPFDAPQRARPLAAGPLPQRPTLDLPGTHDAGEGSAGSAHVTQQRPEVDRSACCGLHTVEHDGLELLESCQAHPSRAVWSRGRGPGAGLGGSF